MELGIRWTIGDVSERGFEALRLSIHGALAAFGDGLRLAVCVNGVTTEEARSRVGSLPAEVTWIRSEGRLPQFLERRIDDGWAEGVAWKLAPLRVFPDLPELALDNDCILWRVPVAVERWLEDPDPCATLVAEDVRTMFGAFAALCGSAPRNTGIRGVKPAFDLEGELAAVLRQNPVPLVSELDEQGMQVAALERAPSHHVVSVRDVSICSPFPPHLPGPGRCGAHFVGLNARHLGWNHDGRPAEVLTAAHFDGLAPRIAALVGTAPPARGAGAPASHPQVAPDSDRGPA